MAVYPLTPLLQARRYREEAATRELRLARTLLEEAESAVNKAREQLRRYREWRPGEEERLFQKIRGKVLEQNELEAHQGDIQALRSTEVEHEETLRQAEQIVLVRKNEVEQARQAQAAAMRGVEKIETHRDRWLRAEKQRLEALEEAQLEDFVVLTDDAEE